MASARKISDLGIDRGYVRCMTTTHRRSAVQQTTIVIVIEPVGRHSKFQVTFDGRVIVPASSTPFLDAARFLIAEGHHPSVVLQMFNVGAAEAALTGPLWAAARLDVKAARFVERRPRAEGPAKGDASVTWSGEGSGGV